MPVISCADDLVRKLVEHFCSIDNEDAEEDDWHKGTVLERHGKSSFLIRYNELQDNFFSHNLYKGLSSDRVRITSVTFHNFIGVNIKHLYTDDTSNKDIWWDAKVVDFDMDGESPDMNDLKFYIVYKDSTDDVIDFSKVCNDDYFLEKLIDDYLNGWVKFASLDLDPIPDSGQQ